MNVILEGVTVTNGYGDWSGGITSDVSISVENCIISRNTSRLDAGGLAVFTESQGQTVTVSNCLIMGNVCQRGFGSNRTYGGGVFCGGGLLGDIVFRNCIIAGNRADFGGGIAWRGHGMARFENCIISDNVAALAHGNQVYAGFAGTTCPRGDCYPVEDLVFTYCNIDDDSNAFYYDTSPFSDPPEVFHLDSCLRTNPEFAIPGSWHSNFTPDDVNDDFWVDGDYHLKSQAGRYDPISQTWIQDNITSPCIDTGDPNSPIGYEPFPNGGIVNIGAYGGTAEASKSYFGEPAGETIIAGDINGDCKVDLTDIALLLRHWLYGYPPDQQGPGIETNEPSIPDPEGPVR